MGKDYFDNKKVEELLTRYVQGACTDRALRDEIMGHALPLIYSVIKAKRLVNLMQPRSEDTIDELAHVAWTRIEQTLYKFEPGRAKVFSFWTQITYLSCLAWIKKHTRDACALRAWGESGVPPQVRSVACEEDPREDFYAVMRELRERVSDIPEHAEMVDLLVEHYETEETPWIGATKALAQRFGRTAAKEFLERVRGGLAP